MRTKDEEIVYLRKLLKSTNDVTNQVKRQRDRYLGILSRIRNVMWENIISEHELPISEMKLIIKMLDGDKEC